MWTGSTEVQMFLQDYCQHSGLIKTDKDTMSLNIFDNIIEELYKEQDGDIDKLFKKF